MKPSLRPLLFSLVSSVLVACSGADAPAPPAGAEPPASAEEDASKSITFTCAVDTPRVDSWDKNRFASLTLVLSGKKATLKNIVYSADYKSGLEQEQSNG